MLEVILFYNNQVNYLAIFISDSLFYDNREKNEEKKIVSCSYPISIESVIKQFFKGELFLILKAYIIFYQDSLLNMNSHCY